MRDFHPNKEWLHAPSEMKAYTAARHAAMSRGVFGELYKEAQQLAELEKLELHDLKFLPPDGPESNGGIKSVEAEP